MISPRSTSIFMVVLAWLSLACLLSGCGGAATSNTVVPSGTRVVTSTSSNPSAATATATGTVVLKVPLDTRNVGGVGVSVTLFSITGLDANGNVVYTDPNNPVPKAETVTLTGVPTTVTTIVVNLLEGTQFMGQVEVAVTVSSGGDTTVTVPDPPSLSSIIDHLVVSPTTVTLTVGQTLQMHAAAVLKNNLQEDVTSSVQWSVSAAGATISSQGLLTASQSGSVTVTASLSPPGPGIVVAADAGGGPQVEVFDASGNLLKSFFAFAPQFTGGVRVAVGDVNGDGHDEIICAAGAGGSPEVEVFSGKDLTVLQNFFAYPPAFTGGVYVAAGDVTNSGFADIITGAGKGGGPQVNVYNGQNASLLSSFFAFDPNFTGGVRVATADVNGDGVPDIVAGAGPGGGSNVSVFDGRTDQLLSSFFAFPPSSTGGIFVAATGGSSGDNIVVGPDSGGGPQAEEFNGANDALLSSFFAFNPNFTGGVRVAGGDVNGDGVPDIIVGAGPGGGPQVAVFDGTTRQLLSSFFAFSPSFTGGIFVAEGNFGFGTPLTATASVTVNASLPSTTTTVTSSLNPSTVGQSVTLTATVSSTASGTPTGTATFHDGTTLLGTETLNGSAQATFNTSSLASGTHSITVTYGGDTNFAASSSAPLIQTVNQLAPALYVANQSNNTVASFTTTGAVNQSFGTNGVLTSNNLSGPQGIAIDASGNLYVTNPENVNDVVSFTSSGTVNQGFGSSGILNNSNLNNPTGVTLDASGNLYLSNAGNSTVASFTSTGTVNHIFGTNGVLSTNLSTPGFLVIH